MPSGGFGNPSIFPKIDFFWIIKLQFSKNFQNFQKTFEKFFEKIFVGPSLFEEYHIFQRIFIGIILPYSDWRVGALDK